MASRHHRRASWRPGVRASDATLRRADRLDRRCDVSAARRDPAASLLELRREPARLAVGQHDLVAGEREDQLTQSSLAEPISRSLTLASSSSFSNTPAWRTVIVVWVALSSRHRGKVSLLTVSPGAVRRQARLSAVGRRPVEPPGELGRTELDQPAPLDRLVRAFAERKPMHLPRRRIHDQDLIDAAGGVERHLLPGLVGATRSRREARRLPRRCPSLRRGGDPNQGLGSRLAGRC